MHRNVWWTRIFTALSRAGISQLSPKRLPVRHALSIMLIVVLTALPDALARPTGKQATQDDSVYCQQTPDGRVIPQPYGGTRHNIPCGSNFQQTPPEACVNAPYDVRDDVPGADPSLRYTLGFERGFAGCLEKQVTIENLAIAALAARFKQIAALLLITASPGVIDGVLHPPGTSLNPNPYARGKEEGERLCEWGLKVSPALVARCRGGVPPRGGAPVPVVPVPSGAGRGPIFADTNLLVAAAERGHAAALAEIRAGETYITPNQLREFLNVATAAQAAARRAFLAQEGIQVFGGPQAGQLAQTPEFQRVFRAVVAAGHGRDDAALAAFARVTGFEAVTLERRLTNLLTNTLAQLGVPIRRVQ